MNHFKSICILSEGYPSPAHPVFTFVEELCQALSRQGVDVTVIAPQNWLYIKVRGGRLHPKYVEYCIEGGSSIKVFRPKILSFPYRYPKLRCFCYEIGFYKALKRLKTKPDVIYGHFWNNAIGGYKYAKEYNVPLFCATGEGNFDVLEPLLLSKHFSVLKDFISGVIAVSSLNKEISIRMGLTIDEKCEIIPNSINPLHFYKKDKKQLRKEYGLIESDFIVAFVGSFIHRKGHLRVCEAIDRIDDDIKSFFIGSPQGSNYEEPHCNGILFKGCLQHDKIVDYLNMSDVFVLPTLNEGCCNAIIEAMACGLPVISSDKPFNYDILNIHNSILIDPNNIDEIANAIKVLKNDSVKREMLSMGALETAKELTIDNRARKVISFIISKIPQCDLI